MLSSLMAVMRLLPKIDLWKSFLFGLGIVFGAVLPVATAVFTGLLVGSIPASLASGIDSPAGRHTLTLLALVGGSVILARVNTPFLSAVSAILGRKLERYLQEITMRAVGRPPGIAHLEDADTLDRLRIVRGLGMSANRPSQAVTGLAEVLPSWLKALGSAVVLMWFYWWLGLVWLVVWPFLIFFMQREYLKVGNVGYGQSAALRRAEYLRDLAMTPGPSKEIRIWGMLDWLIEQFESAWYKAIEPVWKARRPSFRVVFGTSGVIMILNLLSFSLLAWAAVQGNLSLAALAVFIQALLGVNGYMAFNDSNAHISFAAVTVPKVLELDGMLETNRKTSEIALPENAPSVELGLADVSFRYPGSETYALKELNLTIPAYRSMAIVGENGAGKTSLVKLLCGLYVPSAGRITVDGIPVDTVDSQAWRAKVAVLFQDFTRYQLSVRDNIAFGAPQFAGDFDRLRSAARKAGALDMIEPLPHGWDTILSPEYSQGVDLSGGQWQRVALARALFAVESGARVLILDEPTAALDVRAEAELYNRFLEITHGLTTILISHRFSTVRRAERIIVLKEGRIIEDGSHEELIALGGRYAEMFHLQAARFASPNGSFPRPNEEVSNA
jgi:ATP-binding cassette, subfamily B, bacterial